MDTSQDSFHFGTASNNKRKILFDDDEDNNNVTNFLANDSDSDDDLMQFVQQEEAATANSPRLPPQQAVASNPAPPPKQQQMRPPIPQQMKGAASSLLFTPKGMQSPPRGIAPNGSNSASRSITSTLMKFAFHGKNVDVDQMRMEASMQPPTEHTTPMHPPATASSDLFDPSPMQEPHVPNTRDAAPVMTHPAQHTRVPLQSAPPPQQRPPHLPPQTQIHNLFPPPTGILKSTRPAIPQQTPQIIAPPQQRLPPQQRTQTSVQFSIPQQQRSNNASTTTTPAHQLPPQQRSSTDFASRKRPRNTSSTTESPIKRIRTDPAQSPHSLNHFVKQEPALLKDEDFDNMLLKPTQQGSQHYDFDEDDANEIDAEQMMEEWERGGRIVCAGPLRDVMLASYHEDNGPDAASPAHHDPSQKREDESENYEKFFQGKSRKRMEEYVELHSLQDQISTIQQVVQDPDIYSDQVPLMHLVNVRFNHTLSTSELYWITLADRTGTIDAVISHDVAKKTRDHLLDTGVAMLLRNVNLLHIAPQKFCIVIGKKSVLRLASPYSVPRLILKLKHKKLVDEPSSQKSLSSSSNGRIFQ